MSLRAKRGFQKALGLLYPQGIYCMVCTARESDGFIICGNCVAAMQPYDGHELAAFEYEGAAGEAVRRLKFGRRVELAPAMAEFMSLIVLQKQLEVDIVTATPMHWWREWKRGFNQAQLLAECVASQCGWKYNGNILRRTREISAQVGLSREQRLNNLNGIIKGIYPDAVAGKNVLLVDDVASTGATMHECTKVLMSAGAKAVIPLTFCQNTPEFVKMTSEKEPVHESAF